MVEAKRVLLVKLDTLKNVADALTKSVSTQKFSWCRETMGVAELDWLLSSPVAPCGKKTTSGRMLGMCYILSTTGPTCCMLRRAEQGGHMGGKSHPCRGPG